MQLQLGLVGMRMAVGPSLILRPLAGQGPSTSQHVCPKPDSSSCMSEEFVQSCPVAEDVVNANPPMTMSSVEGIQFWRMHTVLGFYMHQTNAAHCTLNCSQEFVSMQ